MPTSQRDIDAFDIVFDEETLLRLLSTNRPSEYLQRRLEILTASGPEPTSFEQYMSLSYLRARRAAWETYLDAAGQLGFLDGTSGNDLVTRLRDRDDDSFRSALAECMTVWFLAGKLGLKLRPHGVGRTKKNVDCTILSPTIKVEVKAPIDHGTLEPASLVNSAPLVTKSVDKATKQLSDDDRNLIVVVPTLPRPLHSIRNEIVRALYGEDVITFLIDPKEGKAVGPSTSKFVPKGRLLKTWPREGGLLSPNNKRIGAVAVLEELPVGPHRYDRSVRLNSIWIDHSFLIAHNPYATNPIPTDLWKNYPQFILSDGKMVWTDGHNSR